MPITISRADLLPAANDANVLAYCVVEPSPVSLEDDVTLRAQVHDAMWMLTQQWRVGEFRGEDAGSPMLAKVETEQILINRFRGVNSTSTEQYNHGLPLEAKVERLPLIPNLFLRLQLGRYAMNLLQNPSWTSWLTMSDFLNLNQFKLPVSGATDYELLSDKRYSRLLSLMSGKVLDGYALYVYLKSSTVSSPKHIYDGLPSSYNTHTTTLENSVEIPFINWVERIYYVPAENDKCWVPEQLEYQFRISAPLTPSSGSSEVVLAADEYDSGELDWYSFDVCSDTKIVHNTSDSISNSTIGSLNIHDNFFDTFIPSPIHFKGMPNDRWWQFEDKNVDLAKLMHSRNDIMGLSLIDFAQNYGNDWYILPHRVKNGSLIQIKNLVVTDSFGQSYMVYNATNNQNTGWRGWKLFALQKKGATGTSEYMLLAPSLIKTVESEPFEKIDFFRDEQANMVWGVESIIPDLWRGARSGKDAFVDMVRYLEENPPSVPSPPNSYVDTEAELAYQLLSRVPEYWIPFVPIQKDFNYRAVNFQRGTFLRVIDDQVTSTTVKPRSALLKYEIDPPTDHRYFIHEEDILRQGLTVKTSFQRCRWYDGSIYSWVTRKATVGKGEGNSNVRFDILKPKEVPVTVDTNTFTDQAYSDVNYVV